MAETEKQELIRKYAAGEVTWHSLQERGFADYVEALAGLGEIGLRPLSLPWMDRTSRRAAVDARSFVRPCGRANE